MATYFNYLSTLCAVVLFVLTRQLYDGINATKETISTTNSSLEEKQKEATVHYMSGNDCFVSLSTGKSLCYGILPYTFDALQG